VTLLLRSTLILYDLFKENFKTGNWGVTTNRCGERQCLLARRENIRCGELGSTRRATKNTRCGELGTTRQAAKYTRWASDDICSLGEFDHLPWRATTDRSANRPLFSLQNPNFDNPKPKKDRKHYLLLFYHLDITSLH